jgi:DNA end-binding protein Ku
MDAALSEYSGYISCEAITWLCEQEIPMMVEPRGTGMALFTLRAADEVRAAQFPSADGEPDPEMVAIAQAIIAQRTDKFDPSTYRDRYQDRRWRKMDSSHRSP